MPRRHAPTKQSISGILARRVTRSGCIIILLDLAALLNTLGIGHICDVRLWHPPCIIDRCDVPV
jgi:hypothetical protein